MTPLAPPLVFGGQSEHDVCFALCAKLQSFVLALERRATAVRKQTSLASLRQCYGLGRLNLIMLNVPLLRREAVMVRAALLTQLMGELEKAEFKRTRLFFFSLPHKSTQPSSANRWLAS